ncbi:RNA polymerase sigma-54 factor, partial [Fusobacterium mortiferum]
MDFSLKLKQETKLVLTQEMKISMNILQMSSSQLREYLEKEATINPAIEISYSTFSTKGVSEEEYSPLDFVTKEETLIDYLEEQIGYLQLSKKIKKICIFIVNNLDSRGYLAISKVELKKLLKINMQELNEAFEIIYTLDPIGIGAENLKDCLKIQLRNKGIYDEKLFTLIEYYLEEVANQNYSIIAQELKIDENKILDYIRLIKTLTPIPARGYRIDTTSNYVVPEAKIEVKNGELVFKINEGVIPKVSVNSYYSESLASDKKFINTAIN